MKKIVTLFALITALCSSSGVKAEENLAAEDNTSSWAQITAGYDVMTKNPAIRFET